MFMGTQVGRDHEQEGDEFAGLDVLKLEQIAVFYSSTKRAFQFVIILLLLGGFLA